MIEKSCIIGYNQKYGDNMREIIKQFFKENRFRTFIQIIFIAINMYLLTIPATLVGNTIDLLYDVDRNRLQIIDNVFLLLGIVVLLLVVRVTWKYVDTLIPRSLERILRDNLFSHFLKMKVSEIQNIKNGELMSYFVKDISELRVACHHLYSFVPRIVFTFIFSFYAMASNVNIKLAIFAMSPVLIAIFFLIKIKKQINIHHEISQKKFTSFSEYIQEATAAIRTTKAYQLEDEQIHAFKQANQEVRDSNIRVNFFSNLLSTVIHACFGLSYGITILVGSKMVLAGTITVGEFVAFNSYIALFINPVSWIPSVVSRVKRGQVSFRRLQTMFAIKEEPVVKLEAPKEQVILQGDIVISDLSFFYPNFMEPVLNHINITITKGETIGIIGKVGSGKSTLMNLLVRLYPVARGKISINGMDINDIPISVLRENICYITQENFLFSTTIKQNVSLFRDVYDEEEIKESIRDAMIFDEIMQLPNGIDTIIGERGVDLSGGQKQRVVISRAFLNKSDIVIFDDTFSALDNRTEQHLLKNIKKLTAGKTCFIISNRISDIKHADRILVLEEGSVIEMGNHKSLMQKRGQYYQFYREQSVQKEESLLS